MEDYFELAGQKFRSRLIVGTGKYKDFAETKKAIEVSGAEIVTVAVRRVNITDPNKENLLDYLDPKKYTILPNTAGCYNADDAVRTCRLAREAGVGKLVKLEVIGDDKTLFPDVPATLDAAKILVKEGFIVLPYITDDPITAKSSKTSVAPQSCRWRHRSAPDLASGIPTTSASFWNMPKCR